MSDASDAATPPPALSKFVAATNWKVPKVSPPESTPEACSLCGSATHQTADCELSPGIDCWFVPICEACYEAKTAPPA